jgi:hypothetical protein
MNSDRRISGDHRSVSVMELKAPVLAFVHNIAAHGVEGIDYVLKVERHKGFRHDRAFECLSIVSDYELVEEATNVGSGLTFVVEVVEELRDVLGAYDQEQKLKRFFPRPDLCNIVS